jgi:hypothetical protein
MHAAADRQFSEPGTAADGASAPDSQVAQWLSQDQRLLLELLAHHPLTRLLHCLSLLWSSRRLPPQVTPPAANKQPLPHRRTPLHNLLLWHTWRLMMWKRLPLPDSQRHLPLKRRLPCWRLKVRLLSSSSSRQPPSWRSSGTSSWRLSCLQSSRSR